MYDHFHVIIFSSLLNLILKCSCSLWEKEYFSCYYFMGRLFHNSFNFKKLRMLKNSLNIARQCGFFFFSSLQKCATGKVKNKYSSFYLSITVLWLYCSEITSDVIHKQTERMELSFLILHSCESVKMRSL